MIKQKKIEKILLIVPPAYSSKTISKKLRDINPLPPMGLGYIASVAESLGIGVNIFDCLIRGWDIEEDVDHNLVRIGLANKDIEKKLQDYQPDLVGINCQFSRQYKMYHELFALIKKYNPDCITVAGGAHVTVCPEEVLNDKNCDFVVTGEGEETFRNLLMSLNDGGNLKELDGFGWKDGDKPIINPKTKWIENLDSIQFPAYHLMDINLYFGLAKSHGERHKKKFSPITTSRGCPAKCVFCSANKVWGKKYRVRSVENVIAEMRILKDQYGIEELMFEDDNVTANAKRAKELFARMIDEKFDFIWDTPNGVGAWSLDNELIDIMKKSGCVQLNFPVESGSQRVLSEIINKPLDLEKIKSLIAHCKSIGLSYGIFLVMGLPGETKKDIWKSVKFAEECGCYNPHISVATPYPGTKLFEICKSEKFFAREFSLDDLFIKSFMLSTDQWTEDDLKKIQFRAKLYLRFKMLINDPKTFFTKVVKRFL